VFDTREESDTSTPESAGAMAKTASAQGHFVKACSQGHIFHGVACHSPFAKVIPTKAVQPKAKPKATAKPGPAPVSTADRSSRPQLS